MLHGLLDFYLFMALCTITKYNKTETNENTQKFFLEFQLRQLFCTICTKFRKFSDKDFSLRQYFLIMTIQFNMSHMLFLPSL